MDTEANLSHARQPAIPRHAAPQQKLILHLRKALTLSPMSEILKRDFYAACPIWFWPVLWWQFAVMEGYLADLYASTGRAQMTYGLALGPRGTLNLVYLSDTARHFAEHGHARAEALHTIRPLMLDSPQPDHARRNVGAGEGARHCLPVLPVTTQAKLYLDPG